MYKKIYMSQYEKQSNIFTNEEKIQLYKPVTFSTRKKLQVIEETDMHELYSSWK